VVVRRGEESGDVGAVWPIKMERVPDEAAGTPP
jgi:hypothetical protein